MIQLGDCIQQRWLFGLSDPSPLAWIITLVYLGTGVFALFLAVYGRFPSSTQRRERLFWLVVAAALLALSVNKQLDLHTLLTTAGRCLSQMQGWYAQRRLVQFVFVIGIFGLGSVLAIFVFVYMRSTARRNWHAMLGLIFVLLFVAIRAAGFHHLDIAFERLTLAKTFNFLLEMAGPLLIFYSTFNALTRNSPD